ncbi:hypothetical protein, conserved in T. vivax [Trypanosoma vivax Y486]|uniref:Uncharacterized protein n=1 Tax=Trypanosoma vivax (strain Y486) TaxID=1055687 RepID=F9WRS5_TRYVY|nr:hypothetical protein, conserved in T. vivax [Trypanosoma vivax Y486]|eukprot:CCD20259.1 hypothetical protein, conserved in T. vivax [Trypanosoma vivax Y486]
MAHAHRSAAAEHGERCSHHLLLAAAVPHPGKQQHATKWKVKFHTRHRTHPRVTAHTTQLSAQAQLAHACVSLPRKRTHTFTAAAPQATQQAPNSAATSAAASTVASSAVALRSATARCAAARHAVSSLTSRAARETPSALRHGTPHPLSLHRIGSAPTRARLLPQHTQAAWLVRPQSFALPPTALAHADGRAVRWPRRGVVPQPPRHQRASLPARSVCEQRGHLTRTGTQQRVAVVQRSIRHNSAGVPNRACVAATASQRRTALSGILYGAAVAHASPHGVSVSCAHCWLNGASNAASCLLQTRHLAVNRHGELFCRHG